MNNKKYRILTSLLPIILGCGLLVAAAALFTGKIIEQKNIEAKLPEYVEKIEKLLPQRSSGSVEKLSDNAMPALEIDGENFVGILELPEFDTKLPIFSVWNQNNTAKRPSLYLGSPYDGNLIIGGNFDFASNLDTGEKVTFTDMYGQVFNYTVTEIRHSDNAKTETLQSDNSDLTLFTKYKDNFLIVECNISL